MFCVCVIYCLSSRARMRLAFIYFRIIVRYHISRIPVISQQDLILGSIEWNVMWNLFVRGESAIICTYINIDNSMLKFLISCNGSKKTKICWSWYSNYKEHTLWYTKTISILDTLKQINSRSKIWKIPPFQEILGGSADIDTLTGQLLPISLKPDTTTVVF